MAVGTKGRLVRLAVMTLALTTGVSTGAFAQVDSPAPGRPWYATTATWARWPTLAAAVGMTAAAIAVKDRANNAFSGLKLICRAGSQNCVVGQDGTYVNSDAERLYQETLRLDAQARRWMIGGQGFLFLSGGLFLIDLVAGHREPKNIPFSPLEAYVVPGKLGLRWRF
jgi:hypothetical protein